MIDSVAIIADTHDNMALIQRLKDYLRAHEVETVFHLGDVYSPSAMRVFSPFEIYAVHGNGDEAYGELEAIVNQSGGHHLGEKGEVDVGDATFYLHHGIDHGKSYGIATGDNGIDYVCHGHWHSKERTKREHGEVLNPGAIGMWLYDPANDSFEYKQFDFEKP